ncbi:hypothetical protein [Vitiosangium sp. GDMCC 1.1324]|uniref:hypothetical protein n=1 Tax=Vitiosangium sp. (strain GDMCC 1.1324) TaxID=2138576 RepID=UPI000D369CDE|nr:hypothetical protein [Vitiosangium sp. GDMCC 1.1324]PTL84970.1 hypothetical protein DAT35_07960 [Vitiosangium sp. GDMCC 1.1324]
MPLDVVHNVDRGVYRLMSAPKDIQGGTPVSDYRGRVDDADEQLQKLFEHYVEGFQFFYPHCDRWWKGCIAAALSGERTREEAVDVAFEHRPAGPASAPEFVWFIRHFWLRCDRINKSFPLSRRIAPEVVLLKWLIDAGKQDYVTLVTCMPYWPIGLNEHGEWC